MAAAYCDIGVDKIGKHNEIELHNVGGTISRDARAIWDNASKRDDVVNCLKTIIEAFEARLRAEGFAAANS